MVKWPITHSLEASAEIDEVAVLQRNVRLLVVQDTPEVGDDLPHRPITIVHNATDSVGVDLLECAIGKGWKVMSRPARRAYQVVLEALERAV